MTTKVSSYESRFLDWIILLIIAAGIGGCGDTGNRVPSLVTAYPVGNETEKTDRLPYGSLLKSHQVGDRRALRVKLDTTRNRLWVLGLDNVYVYDIEKEQLIGQIALPGWTVARFICLPDMLLDRTGAALISSNVLSRLWRVDPDSFEVRWHEIRLHGRENWDIGFGSLAFAPDGTLFAVTALAESLWRIDVDRGRADRVELSASIGNACALTALYATRPGTQERILALCTGGKGGQRIHLSPDLARGEMTGQLCGQ
jgi:hypothetical protein